MGCFDIFPTRTDFQSLDTVENVLIQTITNEAIASAFEANDLLHEDVSLTRKSFRRFCNTSIMNSDVFSIPEKLMTERISTDLNKTSHPTSNGTVLIQFESSTPTVSYCIQAC